MPDSHFAFAVAGIVFGLSCDDPALRDSALLPSAYRHFVTQQTPHIMLHISADPLPDIPLREEDRIFDSEMTWSLYHHGDDQRVFVLRQPLPDAVPYRMAVFDADYRAGTIYNRLPATEEISRRFNALDWSLAFPLPEVLAVILLSQGRGLLAHACGVIDGEDGYLFAGNSTHGKTTMARLWHNQAQILNDDRIVVRLHDGDFWMYSTPWHGDFDVVHAQGIPLKHIFYLQHAPSHTLARVTSSAGAVMLLTRSFVPFWDAAGMQFTLDFCAQVAQAVPCHTLSFAPDPGVVDFVRCKT